MNSSKVPISVLIATRNEAANLPRCLAPLRGWADQIVIVDSCSTDGTPDIAQQAGAEVVQFKYRGGWPKKRQWALDTYTWRNDWLLLLDADEILTEPLKAEIAEAIDRNDYEGYWLRFRIVFLGRMLRFGDTQLWKLFLFRRGSGTYEKRLAAQDASMSDIEVHEHIVVDGSVGRLRHPVRHENLNTLHRYIEKHNEYSTWEANVLRNGDDTAIPPRLFGTQAQRRRWFKRKLMALPGSPFLRFIYVYLVRAGILDGQAGFKYAMFKFVQTCHVKAKVWELHYLALPTPQQELRKEPIKVDCEGNATSCLKVAPPNFVPARGAWIK